MKHFAIAIAGVALAIALATAPAIAQTPPPTAGGATSGGSAIQNPKSEIQNGTLTITVPDPGKMFARILPSPDSKEPEELPIAFEDAKTTLTYDPANVGKAPRVAVDDGKSGNSAIIPLPAAGKPLDLHRADFDHVHVVRVPVTYEGKPVQVARVSLQAPDGTSQTRTIDASAQGIAVFNDVPTGKAKLTVVYGNNFDQTQDVQISTDHAPGALVLPVGVSNKVPTLDLASPSAAAAVGPGAQPAPSAPATAPAPAPQPAPSPVTQPTDTGSSLAALVGNILAIALVAGGAYLFWRWFQSGGFAATMKKAGIELTGPAPASDAGTPWQPNAPQAQVVSDPSLCQFCGQKKDAAGNCACTLSGAAVNTGPASAAVPIQPRLVGTMGVYSGSIFPINANGTGVTLGREATNGIPLGNDTTVSRRHAAIRHENGSYVVSDEGSSNGVFVNGVRITGPQPLHPGDEVQIGNTRFRFEV